MDALVFDTSAILNFGLRGELTPLLKKLSGENKILTTSGAQAELTDPKRKKFYAEFLHEHFTIQDAAKSPFDLATLSRLARIIDPGELTVLMITHKFREVMEYCDEVTVLRRGRFAGAGKTASLDASRMAEMMMGEPRMQREVTRTK